MSTETNGAAVRRLLDLIHREDLAIGDRLPSIRHLAGKLRLGPNIVRDAILQAQTMGLVEVKPRSGTFVKSADFAPLVDVLSNTLQMALGQEDRNLFDLMEARRVIEIELAGQAAARRRLADLVELRDALQATYGNLVYASFVEANEALHLGIAKIAGNGVLEIILRNLLAVLRLAIVNRLATRKDRASDRREHGAIYQSVLDGDVAGARAVMGEHLKETARYLALPAAGKKATPKY